MGLHITQAQFDGIVDMFVRFKTGVEIEAKLRPFVLIKEAKRARTNEDASPKTIINSRKELGRNDPCWCGSGKKWKKCHYPKTSA
jgi:uncharacterized protein YchJ